MSQCATSAGNQERRFNELKSNKGKTNITLACLFAGLGFFLCLLYILFEMFKVEKVTDTFRVELGERVSTKVSDYILGKEFVYDFAYLDMSQVKNEPGEYTAVVRYFFKNYEYQVIIEDTVAPKLLFNRDNYVAPLGEEISVNEYVASVEDESNYSLQYMNLIPYQSITMAEDKSSISFEECGIFEVILRAKDIYGNYKDYLLSVIVDTKPSISGNEDFYVSVGNSVDIYKSVKAMDDCDGDITERLEAYVSDDYLTNTGDYEVTYRVTDSYGLETSANSTIHVYEPLALQDLVNTKKINPFSSHVKGVINPYDSGYLKEDDCETAIENIKKAVVRIFYETGTSRTHGSGYIVSISNSDIIICTNHHVVGSRKIVNVNFYNGVTASGTVVDSKVSPDIAFVRIKRSDINGVLAGKLKTVHFNLNYYNELSMSPNISLGMYCINSDGSVWVENYGKILRKTGTLSEYFENYDYPVTEVSVELQRGVSGSAIVDSHGNFICMAAYYWNHNGTLEYYGVSEDDILDYYEEVFGKRLEYY